LDGEAGQGHLDVRDVLANVEQLGKQSKLIQCRCVIFNKQVRLVLLLLMLLQFFLLFLLLALLLLFTLFRSLGIMSALSLLGCSLWGISWCQDGAFDYLVLTLQISIFLSVLFSGSGCSNWLNVFNFSVDLVSCLSTFFSDNLFFVELEHVNGLIYAELQISFDLQLLLLFLSQIALCLVLFFQLSYLLKLLGLISHYFVEFLGELIFE
jgi:hypothetical protein